MQKLQRGSCMYNCQINLSFSILCNIKLHGTLLQSTVELFVLSGLRFNATLATTERTVNSFRRENIKLHWKRILSLVLVSSLPADEFTLIGRSRFHDVLPSNGLIYGALKTLLECVWRCRFGRPIGKLRLFDLARPLPLEDGVFSGVACRGINTR